MRSEKKPIARPKIKIKSPDNKDRGILKNNFYVRNHSSSNLTNFSVHPSSQEDGSAQRIIPFLPFMGIDKVSNHEDIRVFKQRLKTTPYSVIFIRKYLTPIAWGGMQESVK